MHAFRAISQSHVLSLGAAAVPFISSTGEKPASLHNNFRTAAACIIIVLVHRQLSHDIYTPTLDIRFILAASAEKALAQNLIPWGIL